MGEEGKGGEIAREEKKEQEEEMINIDAISRRRMRSAGRGFEVCHSLEL